MLVPDEKLHIITRYLRDGAPISPRLKFWLNVKKMMMVTLPELDLHDELVVPREGEATMINITAYTHKSIEIE